MRTIIVQPTFYEITQPYEECLKELPSPRAKTLVANFVAGPGEHEIIVLADERSASNIFAGRGAVAAMEKTGSGNTYTGLTSLLTHCDRKELIGIRPCDLPDEDLKQYVWLFDHIEWPTTTCATNIGTPTELGEFLMSEGLLSRQQFDVSDEVYLGNKFFRLFLLAREHYDQLKEDYTLIAQDRDRFYLPSSFDREGMDHRTAQIRLLHALPIPGENVPIQDILEFKAKNSDLLKRLMYHMDEIYLKLIEDGPDVIIRNNGLVAEFEDRVKEVLSEMKKSAIRRALSSIAVQYKLPLTLAGGGVGDVIADVPLELGAVVGALAGYAGSHLIVEMVRGAGSLGKKDRLEPLAYLSLSAGSFQLDLPPSMAGTNDSSDRPLLD